MLDAFRGSCCYSRVSLTHCPKRCPSGRIVFIGLDQRGHCIVWSTKRIQFMLGCASTGQVQTCSKPPGQPGRPRSARRSPWPPPALSPGTCISGAKLSWTIGGPDETRSTSCCGSLTGPSRPKASPPLNAAKNRSSMAPHHRFGQAGRATGAGDIYVVRASTRKRPVRRLGGQHGFVIDDIGGHRGVTVVIHDYQMADRGQLRATGITAGARARRNTTAVRSV